VLYVLLVIIHVIVSLTLILVVLLQVGKGQSIGAAFGGAGSSQTFFGNLFVTPDHRVCGSVHADLAGPGIPLREWRAGLFHHAQNTTRNRHGAGPGDAARAGHCPGAGSEPRVCPDPGSPDAAGRAV
jgi:protein translocase SecG subunit